MRRGAFRFSFKIKLLSNIQFYTGRTFTKVFCVDANGFTEQQALPDASTAHRFLGHYSAGFTEAWEHA
jgi:hypothetical protein